MEDEPDFSGWATKAGLKCTDGRTIMPDAFKHQDQMQVPLVWSHGHSEPSNVLGHAILENRPEGVYCYGFFNETANGQASKLMVEHKDITFLSIWANQLIERGKEVFHGAIREVSLVLAGANPGAKIDFVSIRHSDGHVDEADDEGIIHTGIEIEVPEEEPEPEPTNNETGDNTASPSSSTSEPPKADEETAPKDESPAEPVSEDPPASNDAAAAVETPSDEDAQHAAGDADETLEDVYGTMSEKQKQVVHYMIGEALTRSGTAEHSGTNNEGNLDNQEGNTDMTRSVFEGSATAPAERPRLSHDQLKTIITDADKMGSFKDSFMAHAAEYGIENIDLLFPDAKSLSATPELLSRRAEWVSGVIDGAKHSPFSRVKSLTFDLTADEARAKGYVKGTMKKDEVVKLLRRVTTPTMIYKKQKLDREDLIDITDLDVVAWLKWEMKYMLQEELARAILVGDGREPDDEDKINEDHLRPIAYDDDMYTHKVSLTTGAAPDDVVEAVIRARKHYKGTGTPTFYTTDDVLVDMLLIKDKMNRRIYRNESELAAELRVSKIVVVEVLEDTPDIYGIMVNIADYNIGADRGGELSMFDDFDIDYNQYKYLLETRISGALVKPKSAVVIRRSAGTTVTPQVPGYNSSTRVLNIPNQTGVEYYIDDEKQTAGNQTLTETTEVEARPAAGYNFPHNTDNDWTYTVTS